MVPTHNRKHMITSWGVICYRVKIDFDERIAFPEFLLVQRKDSIEFVEFVRGRYDLDNTEYLTTLVRGMTSDEQTAIVSKDFAELRARVWGPPPTNMSTRASADIAQSERTHARLVSNMGGSLAGLIDMACGVCAPEREWGFPKGRKSSGEPDITCAVREFVEETGIPDTCIHVHARPPYEEVFDGGDGTLYRHVYFLARLIDMRIPARVPVPGSMQAREIANVRWFKLDELCSKFEHHPTRSVIAHKCHADTLSMLSPAPPDQGGTPLLDPSNSTEDGLSVTGPPGESRR